MHAWRVADDSPIGCVLEVDLAYPRKLHDQHQDPPFCPENKVLLGMSTPKPECTKFILLFHVTYFSIPFAGSKEAKLLTTFYNKTRYIIHYRNLK